MEIELVSKAAFTETKQKDQITGLNRLSAYVRVLLC